MTEHTLCRLDDIADGGSAGFEVAGKSVMAIRQGDQVYAYVNSCPHVGTPLDMWPGRFLTRDGEYILCATHGALFRIEDGHCVAGPCVGRGLTPVETRVENDVVNIYKTD
ncbi:MAG: (2Fe-2S)-binding protein [Rhodospirillaceae bacterium]|nr:(2Fe-2S)-binding protein [Magnetovibrio sp.]MAY67719.1 (2Fe-2S)-binding protein [Rhodospirillaceae bacterium]|tara:strand:+ start:118 stop:447 length:330 start_codon:yes stop_codon:yes gene_type:complete